MAKELPKIDLSFREDEKGIIHLNNKELFDTVAKEWADAINRTKKTQARNFYDKILELEEKIKKDDFESVYPFIKMLNSKVAYGVSRRVVSREFQDMMGQCLAQIKDNDNGQQTFKHFKLFFEAVLGFFKGSN
jgi:CRISPR-associated protein Csm2